MHREESRHVRRFIVRIEPGEDVVATLEKQAKTELHRAGWVRGRGVVAWADVASWDDARRAWSPARHLEGPFVATFEGTIATRVGEPMLELDAMLAGRGQATGGRLVACAALSVDVVLEVFEDVRLERHDDDALGMAVWRGDRVPGVVARARTSPSPLPSPSSSSSSSSSSSTSTRAEPEPEPVPDAPAQPLSWAAVAQASAESESPAPSRPAPAPARPANAAPSFLEKRPTKGGDDALPQRGDWVEHRQFGLCKVEGEDPDGGTRVRLPTGARKVLRLDVMEILPPRREADRTVFPVRPRTR